jgi:hypothetical protein
MGKRARGGTRFLPERIRGRFVNLHMRTVWGFARRCRTTCVGRDDRTRSSGIAGNSRPARGGSGGCLLCKGGHAGRVSLPGATAPIPLEGGAPSPPMIPARSAALSSDNGAAAPHGSRTTRRSSLHCFRGALPRRLRWRVCAFWPCGGWCALHGRVSSEPRATLRPFRATPQLSVFGTAFTR